MKPPKIDEWAMREQLLIRAKKDLPHMVGQNFTDVIIACLQFQELTKELNDFSKHQVYRSRILDTMERTTKCV